MNCDQLLTQLPPVPRSVETVLCHLHRHQAMTGKELREATGLPRRTVYSALKRIREMGLLQERLSLQDTRQTYFWLENVLSGYTGMDQNA